MLVNGTRVSSDVISNKNFTIWWVNGLANSAFIYYFAQFGFCRGPMTPQGYNEDIWTFGVTVYVSVLLVM